MKLFSEPKNTRKTRQVPESSPENPLTIEDGFETIEKTEAIQSKDSFSKNEVSFESLGLCDWLIDSCKAMGFNRPTSVQSYCIPAILSVSDSDSKKRRDVMGMAHTGSGKTAAFALPILHDLSRDPFSVFALVITPTRELAFQISEQFEAFGALIKVKVCKLIGGISFVKQGTELERRPHIIIATPGRLRDHLIGPMPPDLSKIKYLVLDEADRLLTSGFQAEIAEIVKAVPDDRQTLLFSATMTQNLMDLEILSLSKPIKYDLSNKATVPKSIKQEYLFIPQQVKACFLVGTLQAICHPSIVQLNGSNKLNRKNKKEKIVGEKVRKNRAGGAKLAIVFVGTCSMCQEICETLLLLGINCVCLHSAMTQNRRLAALGKFKSRRANILVCTDVCSRGLDIPEVDLVINYNVPKVATDYVHRVGRTARAGRLGRALSLVTQYDIELVHNIEEFIGVKMELCRDVDEEEALKLLKMVAKGSRVAKSKLSTYGFDEEIEKFYERKAKKSKLEE
mmetsp:Transcript_319/g.470  ORF Transcript_319/g.470 Transcript_319/m.470 type:complete len:509 (-) Transcript_319:36-1562(-)